MLENQAFKVRLTLVGPTDSSNTFLEPQLLSISADFDFDGTIEEEETYQEIVFHNDPFWTAFEVSDDGRWSENHVWPGFDRQKINDLVVRVTFGSDTHTKTMQVENASPILTGTPIVEIVPGPTGSTTSKAIIKSGVYDQGIKDAHQVKVTWGDGFVSTASLWEIECDPRQGEITVVREFGPNDVLYPVFIELEDDDSDIDTRRIELLDLNVNDDDDNQNETFDLKDTGFNDDELKLVNLDSLKRPGMDPGTGHFRLQYDPSSIRLWTSPSKTTLIYPYQTPPNLVELGLTGITTTAYVDQSTAFVEGISGSASNIIVNWFENDPPDVYLTCYEKHHIEGDSIFVRVWGIDIDTDSDNTDAVERIETEDLIEDQSGQGRKVFVRGTPAEIILEVPFLPIPPSNGYRLELIVAAGLNLWVDLAKTTRLTTTELVSSTIPSDDSLGETYVWNNARAGEMNFYIEGSIKSEPDARRVQWRLIDGQGTIVARDAVRFIVELQNVIFVGIDGTGQNIWLAGPHGHTSGSPGRWNSHVRNLYDEMTHIVRYAHYDIGVKNMMTGSDAIDIHNSVLAAVVNDYNSAPADSKPKIVIVGWSRGAMIAQWVANSLATSSISVDFVGEYDPVDMSTYIPDEQRFIQTGVKRVVTLGPLGGGNRDFYIFKRMAVGGWIELNEGNSTTFLAQFYLNASHGAIGGTPGFNDNSLRFWGEIQNTDYAYVTDRNESMVADEIIRAQILALGIFVPVVVDYGFPGVNPTNTTLSPPGGDADETLPN
jgi:hypothetical protein